MATERIKRALELARAEREGRNAAVAPLLSLTEPAMPAEPAGAVDAPIAPAYEEAPVELTGRFLRTREVEVSSEALRRGRLLGPGLQGPLSQCFRMLRTQVLQRLRARKWNSLAVVSATPDEGKTTVSINLAMAVSADPTHSALLVDFDLRKPSIARRLGIDVTVGAEHVLAGSADVATAFVRLQGYERLMILAASGPVPHSSEVLASTAARDLAEELKARYADRIVIYDLPPLLGADDALTFLPHVDAAIVVVAEGMTKKEHLQRALELLKDTPIVGTVLNQSRGAAQEYYPY
jgi:Mrp family chromosome partitioning ATPase